MPFREKVVKILLRNISKENGKKKILKIIKDEGYEPIDIVWRTLENPRFLCNELECYFNISK